MAEQSLQDRYAPTSTCYGCGPANPKGFHIKSYPRGDAVVTTFHAEPQHEAYGGFLNGGVIGTLVDCHSNWTAAYHLMRRAGTDELPFTVTAEYAVKLLRPTPTSGPIEVVARVVEASDDRAVVESSVVAGGRETARGRGTFVAVKPGHPAYHRW